ncbi:MAG: zinc-binding dehydrogenase [Elusimicrobia bacterium]|nr:zinc-binding dehydrogenase [Elusimicrobiota bacterium]
MKCVVIRKPGGHSALELAQAPDPRPGAKEVLVRVAAAGVNYADCLARMGWYSAARGLYPLTPGFEFSGSVEAVGEGSQRFRPGERVLGLTRFGAMASLISVPEDRLWPCPEGWSLEECAAFPAVFLTAWYGLLRAARAEPGETLLVPSAAGGVGTALLQLARIKGMAAVAVVGAAHKAALCREMGAAAVIDRSSSDLWAEARRCAPAGYDVIFDCGGPDTLREGYRQLSRGGRLVAYGFAEMFPRGKDRPDRLSLAWDWLRMPRFSPLELTSANRGVIGFNVVHLFDRMDLADRAMRQLLGWIREGAIRKVPVKAYPAERAADAHRDLESGATIGKLAVTFS